MSKQTSDHLQTVAFICPDAGAGAAPLAALLEHQQRFKNRKVGLLLSGANIDARLLSSVLMRDLVRTGKELTLSIEMPDKPGQLYGVAGICAAQGANVLEVSHSRFAMDLSASSARLAITIETRDGDHARSVTEAIRAAGFAVTVRDPKAPKPGKSDWATRHGATGFVS